MMACVGPYIRIKSLGVWSLDCLCMLALSLVLLLLLHFGFVVVLLYVIRVGVVIACCWFFMFFHVSVVINGAFLYVSFISSSFTFSTLPQQHNQIHKHTYIATTTHINTSLQIYPPTMSDKHGEDTREVVGCALIG